MRHHAYVIDPTGKRMSITKFVLAHTKSVSPGPPMPIHNPHNLIETKEQFDKFCAGFMVSGYTYVGR